MPVETIRGHHNIPPHAPNTVVCQPVRQDIGELGTNQNHEYTPHTYVPHGRTSYRPAPLIGVYLIGVHLTGMHPLQVCISQACILQTCISGVHLTGAHLLQAYTSYRHIQLLDTGFDFRTNLICPGRHTTILSGMRWCVMML
jgi:hypothetical protein